MTEEQFKRLRCEVEDAKAKAERAQGAHDQLMKRLKEEFGCASIEKAKIKLSQLKEQREEAEAAFNKAASTYEKKWKTNPSN